jgi:hypothetical protein
MHDGHAFVAYPSQPPLLSESIRTGCELATGRGGLEFHAWEQNDIAGRPLSDPILDAIATSAFVVADISHLNFNVTFEIGYAVGIKKRVLLLRNSSYAIQDALVRSIGIFDTLGYTPYANSQDFADILIRPIDTTPLKTDYQKNKQAPVYILESPSRSDAMVRILARVSKARLGYRSFAPSESARLSATDAISHVASSFGVLVPLLSDDFEDAFVHNIRAAFIAGLSHGLSIKTLILQETWGPREVDVLDYVHTYSSIVQIDRLIEKFALDVFPETVEAEEMPQSAGGILENLAIGDPMAENEVQRLSMYYIKTDQFNRAIRGEVNLVVGRKGSGKTALFFQVCDHVEQDRDNVVLNLKPEGYQLIKLKREVLDYLDEGAQNHLITAFWEYILLQELSQKFVEVDKDRHLRDHYLYDPYRLLKASYDADPFVTEGDFSERLSNFSDALAARYRKSHGAIAATRLSNPEVTELIYRNDIKAVRTAVASYLGLKRSVWILFDNLDKGWSHGGISAVDILMIRCLMDAGHKLKRDMSKKGHDLYFIVFLRDDVFQLLMQQTPDFGKEARASLDWSDSDLLREMMRRRLLQNDMFDDDDFRSVWTRICVNLIRGEDTSQHLIERSLMRPRNLITLFNHCKSFAVNLGHTRILGDDVEKGLHAYSNDLIIDFDRELGDVEPGAAGLVYEFLGEPSEIARDGLQKLIIDHGVAEEDWERIKDFLLYYGILGIYASSSEPMYIYQVGYDEKKLGVLEKKQGDRVRYTINPAFWPGLEIAVKGRHDR